jgi:ketol-acid reductoisomerase
MENYFNTLSLRNQLAQLGKCSLMDPSAFNNGVAALENKKIVIVGCGAQGLNQGLNLRDSGLDVSYALRQGAITDKRTSF